VYWPETRQQNTNTSSSKSYLVIFPPQIVQLSFADLLLALVVVDVVKTVVEVSKPEHCTADATTLCIPIYTG